VVEVVAAAEAEPWTDPPAAAVAEPWTDPSAAVTG